MTITHVKIYDNYYVTQTRSSRKQTYNMRSAFGEFIPISRFTNVLNNNNNYNYNNNIKKIKN